jgi:hypothetical protein
LNDDVAVVADGAVVGPVVGGTDPVDVVDASAVNIGDDLGPML